jgi:hypothetical protein
VDRRSARLILVVALVVGLFAQALFYRTALGVNLILLQGAVLVAAVLLARPEARIDRADLWIPPAALLFAGFPAIRADPAVVAFDVLAAAGLGAAAVAAIGGAALTRRSLTGLLVVAARGSALVAGGALEPARGADLGIGAERMRGGFGRLGPLVRGLLIAAPLVLLFAILFAAADAVFEDLLNDVFSIELDLGELPGRTAIAAVVAWLLAGLLVAVAREVFAPEGRSLGAAVAGAVASRPRLGLTEAVVVLTAVDLLFAVFVGLQVTYLFGGRDTLAATGMTYSDYARRGFFELVLVALLAGGLIATLEGLVRGRSRAYLASAVGLAALALVVLASATLRLKLYQDAYGWTELRFYVYASIAWLGLGALATVALLLAGRTRWLAHAVGILFIVVALAVNAIGPQAFVARQNLARAIDPDLVAPGGRTGLDVWYLIELGPDAVPVMVEALPYIPPEDRAVVESELRSHAQVLERPELTAWPAWNLAREQARAALAGHLGP